MNPYGAAIVVRLKGNAIIMIQLDQTPNSRNGDGFRDFAAAI